jgi:diguanylate cyclase (GGDEF)-like protein
MTPAESALVHGQQANRGEAFFSDLIYAVSHHYVRPEQAEGLWSRVLSHKQMLSERLGRNVRIAVAMLDYLSNITSDLKAPTLISEDHVSELVNLSMRDGMTGLFNHSTCYELLALELGNHRRHGVGVAVLLLDIDDFKLVNDENGHQEGDRILVALTDVLRQEARSSDICGRLGGDEFVVILRFTHDAAEACRVAERIRTKAASISFGGKTFTISAGVALCDGTTASARGLMERADRALYAAKVRGKNRVCLDLSSRPQNTGLRKRRESR